MLLFVPCPPHLPQLTGPHYALQVTTLQLNDNLPSQPYRYLHYFLLHHLHIRAITTMAEHPDPADPDTLTQHSVWHQGDFTLISSDNVVFKAPSRILLCIR